MKVSIVALLVGAFTLISTGSQANIIATGAPVDSNGDPLSAAVLASNVGANGAIKFFIPLSGGHAGTFGVGGVGLNSGYFNGSGGAGSMDMFLSFSPTAGGNALHFFFKDLDLVGVNDPRGFLENIAIYNQDMTKQLAFVDNASDPEVVAANRYRQGLAISLASILPSNGSLGDPFVAKLRFSAGRVPASPGDSGRGMAGYNTPEKIKAYLIRVPEPGSLAMFGIGLLGVGFLASTRRKRAA